MVYFKLFFDLLGVDVAKVAIPISKNIKKYFENVHFWGKACIISYPYVRKLLNCYNHKDHFGLITDVQRSGQCPTDV